METSLVQVLPFAGMHWSTLIVFKQNEMLCPACCDIETFFFFLSHQTEWTPYFIALYACKGFGIELNIFSNLLIISKDMFFAVLWQSLFIPLNLWWNSHNLLTSISATNSRPLLALLYFTSRYHYVINLCSCLSLCFYMNRSKKKKRSKDWKRNKSLGWMFEIE